MSNEPLESLKAKYERLKGAEQQKNSLIEQLFQRLDEVTESYRQETLDHAREIAYNREVQKHEIQMQDRIRKYEAFMERDPFVLILIDGDGMIFDDTLLCQGEAGGREAASLLFTAVAAHVEQIMPNLRKDVKIVTRLYANSRGLGDACYKAGILPYASLIEDFARGFTGKQIFFDFIDVGSGKDRADDKLSEIFKLHLYDSHCRHIYLGCSHDNGYARLLEAVPEETLIEAITLVEGVPFERELIPFTQRYRTTNFPGLFRTQKINIYQPQTREHVTSPPFSNGLPPPPAQYQSPHQPVTSAPQVAPPAPRPASSSGNNGLTAASSSWAAAAKALPVISPSTTPLPSKQVSEPAISRNRYGQRIDPMIKVDPLEVKRIKGLKMCNVHFLKNECPYEPCTHDHFYKPNQNELNTLKFVSRMTPCWYGLECDDVKCLHGHRCPVDVEGQKTCKFGEDCRFPKEAHGIDRTVVNTVKIGGR